MLKYFFETDKELFSQIKNHAYGVTGVRRVAIGSGINAVLRREKLSLVRNMKRHKRELFPKPPISHIISIHFPKIFQ